MATIAQALERIGQLEQLLQSGLVDVLRVAGGDMCAAIADRVINEGKGPDNRPFSAYSTKAVPAYLYFGRSRSGSGESRVKAAAKERRPISYRDFRSYNNLPTAFKNFSFTNDMWRHFGVKGVNPSSMGYTLTIGGTSASAAQKMDWQRQKEDRDITAPNPAELARLNETIVNHIQSVIGG